MLMHDESYIMQQIAKARARGQKMAKARWAKDRARRDALAAMAEVDPLRVPGRILMRVVVLGGNQSREIIRRDGTSAREWARLKRSVGL